jgi:hypothetical protein
MNVKCVAMTEERILQVFNKIFKIKQNYINWIQ